MNNELKEAIRSLSGTKDKDLPSFYICTVESFDLQTQTCNCIPVGGDATTAIPGVQLKADPNNGILVIPKIGSTVVVAMSLQTSAYLFMFSDIDSMEVAISNGVGNNPTRFKIEAGKIQMNDGSLGGLTKTQELKTQIDKMNVQLQQVIASLSGWTVVANDGGLALKTNFIAGIAGKPAADFTQIENTLIRHGI